MKPVVNRLISPSEKKELEIDRLELRVKERTAELENKKKELERVNRELTEEVRRRTQVEVELKLENQKSLTQARQRDFLSRKLVDMLEKERNTIGNILHDEIGQTLTGIHIQLENLKDLQGEDPSILEEEVEELQARLRDALNQTKNISHNMRAEVLERFGLIPSIENMVEEMNKRAEFDIFFHHKNIPTDSISPDLNLTLFRVVQESLTNILKHAEAEDVFINLFGRNGWVFLCIEDDGKGFDYQTCLDEWNGTIISLGLAIMKERVCMVDGSFCIDSKPGRGTQVFVAIPADQNKPE